MAAVIGIAVVEHDGCFLVGIRSANQVLGGFAEFPGGKCRSDESTAECAVRECHEETGLAIEARELLERVEFHYPHGDIALYFWNCRLSGRSIEPGGGFRWIKRADLATLDFPPANASVLQKILGSAATGST